MTFEEVKSQLDAARLAAQPVLRKHFGGQKPKIFKMENASGFFSEAGAAIAIFNTEKELLLFAFLQWLVIALAYLCWTQMLRWIPDPVWDYIQHAPEDQQHVAFTFLNIALLVWSFIIVIAASYPIAIFSGAIVAARNLRTLGQRPGIFRCLAIAESHIGRAWIFSTLDDWITVKMIFNRLPKKHSTDSPIDEFFYYAWKVGTIVVLPALVAGKGFIEAAKDSVKVLNEAGSRAVKIRLGYSMICWVVGVVAYVGGFVWWLMIGSQQSPHWIYNFYFLMAVPIIVAAGIVTMMIRPIYLLAVSKLYTDVLTDKVISDEADPILSKPGGIQHALRAVFLLLVLGLMAAYFFGDQLGIVRFVQHLAALDFRTIGS